MGQALLPIIDPIPGYRFTVFLNGMIMGFQKVSGIGREVETEVYHEGGLNTRVHVFPKYCNKEKTLLMEKGACKGTLHPFCLVGDRLEGPLNLIVMDNQGNPLKSYLFTGLTVKAWEVGELSAEQSAILTDRFEVSYEDFEVSK
ncbi:MAG: phage tail protein [bacterium]|nr:phage tail protein [bacterium]MCM1374327.1 phage tail protein [Muribaculum sp.]